MSWSDDVILTYTEIKLGMEDVRCQHLLWISIEKRYAVEI